MLFSIMYLCTTLTFAQWNSGNGTAGNPYQITTVNQLKLFADSVNTGTTYTNTYFKLMNNLSLSGVANWTPIGITSTNSFRGNFDGNNHTISGLTINLSTTDNVGLFGFVNNGTISNLGVTTTQVGVTGRTNVGILVGSQTGGQITNCYVMGTLVGNDAVGGMIGNQAGTSPIPSVSQCFAIANVTESGTAGNGTGGLIGVARGSVTNSYAWAQVKGVGSVAALCGTLSTNGVVDMCYAVGNAASTSSAKLGSIGGNLSASTSSRIFNSVAATNAITGNNTSTIGRIAGQIPAGALTNNYAWDEMTITVGTQPKTIVPNTSGVDGGSETLDNLKSQTFYISSMSWDVGNVNDNTKIWNIWNGINLPYLQKQSSPVHEIIETSVTSMTGKFNPNVAMDSIVIYRAVNNILLPIGKATVNNTDHTFVYNALDASMTMIYLLAFESGKAWPSYPFEYNTQCAQLGGTYHIRANGTGNFASLKEAADKYNTCGLTANTTLIIESDLAETLPVVFLGTAPNSEGYTLTITSDGTQRTVSGNVNGALVTFTNANNITIDGGVPANAASIDLGTNNTKLIFRNTNTSANAQALTVNGTSSTTQGENIVIKNTTFTIAATIAAVSVADACITVNSTNAVKQISGCYLYHASTGINLDNMSTVDVLHNVIRNINYRAIVYRSSTSNASGLVNANFIGNDIGNITVQGSNVDFLGLFISASPRSGNIKIDSNIFNNITNNSATSGISQQAIRVTFGGNTTVSNNRISNLTSSGAQLIGIYSQAAGSGRGVFEKNTIQNITGNGDVRGMYIARPSVTSTYEVRHNTVNMITNNSGTQNAIGISLNNAGRMFSNAVYNINGTNTAYGISTEGTSNVGQLFLANNMVGRIFGNITSAAFNLGGSITQFQVLHNTANLSGNTGTNTYNILFTTSTNTNFQFKNNLLLNSATAGTAAIFRNTTTNVSGTYISSSNRYVVSGTATYGRFGANAYNTLNGFNTLVNDNTSTSVSSVSFVSGTDLHLADASRTDAALNVPILVNMVETDFDDEYRSGCSNSAGADGVNNFQITKENVTASGCENGAKQISLVVSPAATAPYTYDFDFSGNFQTAVTVIPVSSGDSLIFNPVVTAGAHKLIIKDNNGCTMVDSILVPQGNPFPTVTMHDTAFCSSITLNLQTLVRNVNGAKLSDVQFSQTGGATFDANIITNFTAYSTASTITLYARATGANGCPSPIVSFKIQQNLSLNTTLASVRINTTANKINLIANDIIPTVASVALSTQLTAQHGTATVSNNGVLEYTPFTGNTYTGIDSLRYIVTTCGNVKDSAMVYIAILIPGANEYYACPNAGATLSINTFSGVQYYWFKNQTDTVPLQNGSNVNSLSVLKDNTSLQRFWIEPRYNNMVFPRYYLDLSVSQGCGSFTPSGCSELGSLLFKENFGGNNPSDLTFSPNPLPAGVTNYTFRANVNDMAPGSYCIVKNNVNKWPEWYNFDDHTYPNDVTRGYYMGVDADVNPGLFYIHTISDLCPGTKLFFSIWMGNLMKVVRSFEYSPSLRFVLTDAGTNMVLAEYSSGEMEPSDGPVWRQYGFPFTTQTSSSIRLSIYSNTPQQSGNDLVLDDIEIHLCVPNVDATANADCGTPTTLSASYTDDGTFTKEGTITLTGHWMQSTTGNPNNPTDWTEIAGSEVVGGLGQTTLTSIWLEPAPANGITKYYRFIVADETNINNINCRASSNVLSITGKTLPTFATTDTTLCEPTTLNLQQRIVNLQGTTPDKLKFSLGTGSEFAAKLITDPVNFYDTATTRIYVTATNPLFDYCQTSDTVFFTLTLAKVTAADITSVTADTTCAGGTATLNATTSSGFIARWYGDAVLTNFLFEGNAYTTPVLNTTTTYYVVAKNIVTGCFGGISTAQPVTVNINPLPTALLSADAEICQGEQIALVFTLTGQSPWTVTFQYGSLPTVVTETISTSPYQYFVSPNQTTTYTLIKVVDGNGCEVSEL